MLNRRPLCWPLKRHCVSTDSWRAVYAASSSDDESLTFSRSALKQKWNASTCWRTSPLGMRRLRRSNQLRSGSSLGQCHLQTSACRRLPKPHWSDAAVCGTPSMSRQHFVAVADTYFNWFHSGISYANWSNCMKRIDLTTPAQNCLIRIKWSVVHHITRMGMGIECNTSVDGLVFALFATQALVENAIRVQSKSPHKLSVIGRASLGMRTEDIREF